MTSSNNTKYNFTGKVALVTGSSSGIGAAIAVQLAQYGAKLTITGRNAANLEKIAQKIVQVSNGCKPLLIIGDLSDGSFAEKLINQTIGKYGRLDYLVNSAGEGNAADSFDNPNMIKVYDQMMNSGLRATLALIQGSIVHLEKTKGSVINISGISSVKPMMPIGSVWKAGLDMLTKVSASHLAAKGIRVNSINPGPVFTSIGRMFGNENYFRDNADTIKASVPLNRIAEPEEIADLAAFLLSDEAKNITGSIVLTDGGLLVKSGW